VNSNYYNRFRNVFEGKAFKVLKAKDAFIQKDLVTPENNDGQHTPYDMKFLKGRYRADYALLLYLHSHRLIRDYSGFTPLDRPSGHASLSFYLVNLSDNSIGRNTKLPYKNPLARTWIRSLIIRVSLRRLKTL